MKVVSSRRRRRSMVVTVLIPIIAMILAQGPAQVAATTLSCPSGMGTGARWHAIMQTHDVDGNSGTGTEASWPEVLTTVDDYYTTHGFTNAEMWNILQQTPNQRWVETGFTNRLTFTDYPSQTNHSCIECFFMAYGDDNANPHIYDQLFINKTPSGQGVEHDYKMVWNSVTTGWDTWIDGVNYGGYHSTAYILRVDIGTESTDPCSTIPTTSFGGNTVPRAFQYRVGINGFWTTWGSGTTVVDGTNSNYHVQWDHYAIFGHVWGP